MRARPSDLRQLLLWSFHVVAVICFTACCALLVQRFVWTAGRQGLVLLLSVASALLLGVIAWPRPRLARAIGRDKERIIAENEARLRAILDGAADSIITIGEDGIVQSFNPAAERAFGYAASEVIGGNVTRIIPPQHAAHHDSYIQRFLRTGEKRIIGIGRETEGLR